MPASAKLYNAVAETMADARHVADTHPVAQSRAAQVAMVDNLIQCLADEFSLDNPRFDQPRFLRAANFHGVNDNDQ